MTATALTDWTSNPTLLNDHTDRVSHGHCGHPATKAGRAWCRRQGKTDSTPKLAKVTSIHKPKAEKKSQLAIDVELLKKYRKRSTAELEAILAKSAMPHIVAAAEAIIADRQEKANA